MVAKITPAKKRNTNADIVNASPMLPTWCTPEKIRLETATANTADNNREAPASLFIAKKSPPIKNSRNVSSSYKPAPTDITSFVSRPGCATAPVAAGIISTLPRPVALMRTLTATPTSSA